MEGEPTRSWNQQVISFAASRYFARKLQRDAANATRSILKRWEPGAITWPKWSPLDSRSRIFNAGTTETVKTTEFVAFVGNI